MAGSGQREIKQFHKWLQKQQTLQIKHEDRRLKDGSYRSRFLLGGMAIAIGTGSSASEARTRADQTAREAWYQKPQELKTYLQAHKRGEAEAPEWNPGPNTSKPKRARSQLQSMVPAPRSKARARPIDKTKDDAAEIVSSVPDRAEERPDFDKVTSRLEAVESLVKEIRDHWTRLSFQVEANEDATRDVLTQLKSCRTASEEASATVAALSSEIAVKSGSIDQSLRLADTKLATVFNSITDLHRRLDDVDSKVAASQVNFDLLFEEVGRIDNLEPSSGAAGNAIGIPRDATAARATTEQSVPSPIQFPGIDSSSRVQKLVAVLDDHLARWFVPSGDSLQSRAALVSLLGAKISLIPELVWVPALREAFGNSRVSVIPVEAWWVSFADLWQAGLCQAWAEAMGNPTALQMVILQDMDRSLFQLWGTPLMNIVGGITNHLPQDCGLVWPNNLKLLSTVASDDATLPIDSSVLYAFAAICPSSPETEVSKGSSSLATSQNDASVPLNWKRAVHEDIEHLMMIGAQVGIPATAVREVAHSIRIHWPRGYTKKGTP